MTRMYKAVCLRDTVQDNPYQYFRAGKEYVIPEDSPVSVHFRPVEELSRKEAERIAEEGPPPGRPAAPEPEKKGGVRVTVPDKKGIGKK